MRGARRWRDASARLPRVPTSSSSRGPPSDARTESLIEAHARLHPNVPVIVQRRPEEGGSGVCSTSRGLYGSRGRGDVAASGGRRAADLRPDQRMSITEAR